MFQAHIRFHFGLDDLPLLKSAAALHRQDISPSLRMEILSRGCGFGTYAALQAALKVAKGKDVDFVLDLESASRFAEEKSFSFRAEDLYAILASAAFPKVGREHPLLHRKGLGKGCLRPHYEERTRILHTMKGGYKVLQKIMDERLENARSEFRGMYDQREFLQALAFMSCLTPIKGNNDRHGSYGLKHIAEDTNFILPEGIVLAKEYVHEHKLIAAALYAGFVPHSRDNFNTYGGATFNISQKSIKPIRDAYYKR